MKISAKDLIIISSLANTEYINGNIGILEPKEFISKCWIMAMNSHLKLGLELEFPKQNFHEPDDE